MTWVNLTNTYSKQKKVDSKNICCMIQFLQNLKVDQEARTVAIFEKEERKLTERSKECKEGCEVESLGSEDLLW